MKIFEPEEVEILAERLFRKAMWKKSFVINDLVLRQNHSGGGRPIPLSSQVNCKGHPVSPILRQFLAELDHRIYVDFFTKIDKGRQMLSILPESIQHKILLVPKEMT